MLFRGSIRVLSYLSGMTYFLSRKGILMKDFLDWAKSLSKQMAAESASRAESSGRPLRYLASSQTSKEEIAASIARRDGIENGLICILSCVESCQGYDVYRNRQAKTLDLVNRRRKCLHHYHYLMHPQFGLCHVRLQTWVPFQVQICLNGREWLARQLKDADIGFIKRDNCFPWIEAVDKAQALAETQLSQKWEDTLEGLLHEVIPSRYSRLNLPEARYYWSLQQSEWASDIMFRSPKSLKEIYPPLVRHAMNALQCEDVLRFLGRVNTGCAFKAGSQMDVISDLRRRPEGVRVRHCAGDNAVKMYDKEGSVLRIETTINNIREFREKRTDTKTGKIIWRRMRKGVVSLRRRAEISQGVNDRYGDALAAANLDTPVGDLITEITRPVVVESRRHRALNPWAPSDARVLRAIADGRFIAHGLRNRDLRSLLYAPDQLLTSGQQSKASSAVTRVLARLRAHRLIKKVPGTHRYLLTARGRQITAAILNLHHVPIQQLLKVA